MLKSFLLITVLFCMPLKPKERHDTDTEKKLKTGWYYVSEKKNEYPRVQQNTKGNYYINPKVAIPVYDIKTVEITAAYEPNTVEILMRLNKRGTDAFYIATRASIDKRFAFILDDKLIYTAIVNAQISSGLAAINGYKKSELEDFAEQIKLEMVSGK